MTPEDVCRRVRVAHPDATVAAYSRPHPHVIVYNDKPADDPWKARHVVGGVPVYFHQQGYIYARRGS